MVPPLRKANVYTCKQYINFKIIKSFIDGSDDKINDFKFAKNLRKIKLIYYFLFCSNIYVIYYNIVLFSHTNVLKYNIHSLLSNDFITMLHDAVTSLIIA